MTMRTRLLTMPIALALVTGACAVSPSNAPPSGAATPAATTATSSPVPTASNAPSAPPATGSSTVDDIARLQATVAAKPTDQGAQRDLGFALLQRIRETADPTLYDPALAAFEAAQALDPDDGLTLVGIGGIYLGRHEFAEALIVGRKAVALSPNLATARAVVVDALVELGRYDEADAEAASMLGIAADLSTLSRVSYLAELRGKLDVALAALRLAAKSPALKPENAAFVAALTGNLLVYTGDREGAAAAYQHALDLVPAHAPSVAGLARLAVGAGDLDEAIALYTHASDILPLPEYVIALADVQEAAGLTDEAARSVKLGRAEIQLFLASGVIVDVDLALFEADHGDPAKALEFAEAGYAATPTIRAADAIAWALHRLGRDMEARSHSDEALSLGSRDPLLRYHAGVISAALGETARARRDLELALSTDPGFSATGAAEARRLLASLPG
jgi:tetratricopeptide (TPR) repeat protein